MSQKTMKDYITGVKLNIARHSIIKHHKIKPVSSLFSVSFQLKAKIREAKNDSLSSINRKSRRGFVPERVIDLHGLSQNEAFSELVSFFIRCQADGVRKALIITGGNSMKKSVLRDSFLQWARDSFGNYIAACSQSNIQYGGQGAFYVHVKKNLQSNL
ncbi:MAG: Smr/MutS family protein [Holosporaceae bacterium]|nr:Smr/MutS family protein [Holosporaceae bacterium]